MSRQALRDYGHWLDVETRNRMLERHISRWSPKRPLEFDCCGPYTGSDLCSSICQLRTFPPPCQRSSQDPHVSGRAIDSRNTYIRLHLKEHGVTPGTCDPAARNPGRYEACLQARATSSWAANSIFSGILSGKRGRLRAHRTGDRDSKCRDLTCTRTQYSPVPACQSSVPGFRLTGIGSVRPKFGRKCATTPGPARG
jgi:hypothetical protein